MVCGILCDCAPLVRAVFVFTNRSAASVDNVILVFIGFKTGVFEPKGEF